MYGSRNGIHSNDKYWCYYDGNIGMKSKVDNHMPWITPIQVFYKDMSMTFVASSSLS